MKPEIQIVHGELRSVFHIIDTEAPEEEQPKVIATFHSRENAEEAVRLINRSKKHETRNQG